ncbi:MAG: GAG-pre-integrase domain-containing protein, partial [Actinobacteria bacterium]|nr:GAG-pre-integrase domain-containing protein [Actinomycetota bacterium]
MESFTKLLHDNNHNLNKPQKELLLWHNRLGHAGLRWIQDLMRVTKSPIEGDTAEPPLILSKAPGAANCVQPICPACQMAKQHRRTPGSQRVQNVPEHEMAIRREDLQPGDCVSVDQYICKVPGRMRHGFGRGRSPANYTGGTIFVDHASGYISVRHQISLRAGETVQQKHAFERHAKCNGVRIKQYRADNHPFRSAEFLADIETQDQTISYSGVGAHHQNGVSERGIQTVSKWALAMMMHQLIHWPAQFDPALWPFALEHAAYIWNNMPKERGGLTPAELFAGMKRPQNDAILRSRVWGCPVYVLDPKLQDGKKLPKWRKRSRLGVYLGVSPEHSTTVGRVLNTETGYISPQYH